MSGWPVSGDCSRPAPAVGLLAWACTLQWQLAEGTPSPDNQCCLPAACLSNATPPRDATPMRRAPQELEAARRAPRGVQELGEEDMGRLAAAAKAAGMEELFLTALKLVPRGE